MTGESFTRRNLPHWYVPGAAHFVTYRLAGTIPARVYRELQDRRERELSRKPPPGMTQRAYKEQVYSRLFAAYDRYLDRACPIDWLRREDVGEIIRENLYHHDGTRYHLLSYCIMPNHVHLLLQPIGKSAVVSVDRDQMFSGEIRDARSPLAKIMHSLKSYTANLANELLGRSGQFWQHESYDHWVRDEGELERIVHYIRFNPVKAGLVQHPGEWWFGSAYETLAAVGSDMGLLKLPLP